jgi:hypothetical protein
MTENVILMWICEWWMMWTHRMVLFYTVMWTWKGRAKMRKMKRRNMRRRRRWWMRMRRRKRIMAKNLGQLARERW